MRLFTVSAIVALVFACACQPVEMTYQRHLLRFEKSEPSLLLVSIPNRIVFSRPYETGSELAIESRVIETMISDQEKTVAEKISSTLMRFGSGLKMDFQGPAGNYITEVSRDPRYQKDHRFKMARVWKNPKGKIKKVWRPEDDKAFSDESLDERFFEKLVCISRGPFNNTGRTLFRVIEAQSLQENYDVNYLLLIEITDMEAKALPDKIEFSMVVYSRLFSLSDGLLIFEYRDLISGNEPGAVLGNGFLSLTDLEAFRQNDYLTVRNGLQKFGERFGYILAGRLGFITESRLNEEKQAWQNDRNYPAATINQR